MSELAYNLQGERFQAPATAASWRVRRLKPGGRGTPDVVFGKDGAPLMLPVETDLVEFRRAIANQPGRYRLDPVTEDHLPCEGGQPAYLHISEDDDSAGNGPVDSRSGATDDLLRELVRANTEMVRNIADRFASVMDSAAVLIRAADGAGLPARDPMALPPHIAAALRNAAVDDSDDGEDDDEDFPTLAAVLQTTIDRAMPIVNHAVNTKVLGLTPEQSIALMGGNAGAAQAMAAPPTTKKTRPATTAAPASPSDSAAKSSADFMPHLMAIEAQLSPEEKALARVAVGAMPPAAIAAWRDKLLAMSPADAAAMIRAEVSRHTTDGSAAESQEAA